MSAMLEGIRVVEVASFVAAPAAGTMMSDFGAEVIHVEPPGIGDPQRLLHHLRPLPECEDPYAWILDSRNKQSVVLNLKQTQGLEALHRLVATADVFITNYQPSVLEELSLRYEDLRQHNERMIYAHVTGYGDRGAEADKPGYDASAWWARSGLMDLIRPANGEVAMSAPAMGDHPTSVATFGAIMAGLFRRERTGEGGKVSTSLLANGLWANSFMVQAALCNATPVERFTHAESPNPLVCVYETRDGRLLFLVMVKEAFEWELFCDAIDREDLKHDPRFNESTRRRENNKELVNILDGVFAGKTLDEWTRILDHHRVTFGLVQPYDALPDDPQAIANGLYPEIAGTGGMRTIDSPINIEGETKCQPRMAPEHGEHTGAVLRELGYADADIDAMAAEGAIELG